MKIDIITAPLNLDVSGFSGTALNKDYADTAFRLMDKMWQSIKNSGLKHKGINIWIYEPEEKVFAGVELETIPEQATGLEKKSITIKKYAQYKHVGPYSLIRQSGQQMKDELKNMGFETILPYVEIYGHWQPDESKLETELIMSLK